MKELLLLTFSFIIISGATVPCCLWNEDVTQTNALHCNDDSHDNESDTLPVCKTCAQCYVETSPAIYTILFLPQEKLCDLKEMFLSNFFHSSMWQPPKNG